MSSVKFNSLPPVAEFGKDVVNAVVGTGTKQEKAINNLSEKWSYNILLPYGGNQVRKSLQGIEASNDIELPFVRNTSKNIDIQSNFDKAKSILFGPYSTEESISYFENQKRQEGIKEQAKAKIRPIYNQVEKLKAEGKIGEAEALYNAEISDEEDFVYQTIKTSEKTKKTNEDKKRIQPIYNRIEKLKSQGKMDEANAIYNAEISDEDDRIYQLIKKADQKEKDLLNLLKK